MKKCILSAIGGALAMLVCLIIIANISVAREQKQEKKTYEHIDYVSAITQDDCFICGTKDDPLTAAHWSEDNVAILDLNTFEILRLEINRYGDHGEPVTTEAGYMQSYGMETETGWVHTFVHPDRGYADVNISGVEYNVDRDSIQSHLCQTCLDSINGDCFGDDPPAELAVVNYTEKTIRPLITCTTGFGAGNFYVDCEFKEEGRIDLLIFYCPPRYK